MNFVEQNVACRRKSMLMDFLGEKLPINFGSKCLRVLRWGQGCAEMLVGAGGYCC